MTDDEFITWIRRQGKPPSQAKERRYYGDPANTVEFASEIERRKKAKKAKQQKGR